MIYALKLVERAYFRGNYRGSVVAIDPKGELATLTAARRATGGWQNGEPFEGMGQYVFVLDPFEITQNSAPQFRASINPLDRILPEDSSIHPWVSFPWVF